MAQMEQNPAVGSEVVWEELRDRIATLEDRSRRANLRFVGFAPGLEKDNAAGFLNNFLGKALDVNPPPQGFEFQRVHRVRTQRAKEGSKTIIAAFLRYRDRQMVMQAAREKREIMWEGNKIMIFADYSKETLMKREAFRECKKLLHERKKTFSLLYPAVLRIDMDKGTPPKVFSDPQLALDFIKEW